MMQQQQQLLHDRSNLTMNGAVHEGNAGHSPTGSNTTEIKESPPKGLKADSPHKKRKREAQGNSAGAARTTTNMSLSSSSSSSSSDEDDAGAQRRERNDDASSSSGTPDQQSPPSNATPLHLKTTKGQGQNPKDSSPDGEPLTQDDPVPSDKRGKAPQHINTHPTEGWRVKLYRLNTDGSWDDCGTGSILCLYKKTQHMNSSDLTGDAWVYHELGEPTLCMHAEIKHPSSVVVTATPRILLRTRILLRDAYQRQGDNIITWCEPYLEDGNQAQGVDLALSFQDIAGCLDIWRQITQVQARAAELFRETGSQGNRQHSFHSHDRENGDRKRENNKAANTVEEMAHATAAAHHANLQRQQQQEMWMSVASEAAQHHLDHQNSHSQHNQDHHSFGDTTMIYHESSSGVVSNTQQQQSMHLPNPPRLANLEEIADMIAAVQVC
jgi:protein phosphatase-4 regulatory subunit 3